MIYRTKKKLFIFSVAFFVISIFISLLFTPPTPNREMIVGTTFNDDYARFLGLEPREVFKAVTEEWGFKYIRLSAQWNNLEREQGKFDFNDLDWYMDTAASNSVKVVLVVGQKTPHWPECHLPEWVYPLVDDKYETVVNTYVREVVERYRHHPALEMWQVDNEPYLPFGICPKFSEPLHKQTIRFVKELDPEHPTLITDSGELSLWLRATRSGGDRFGTTLYRKVWSPTLGYISDEWIPANWYRWRMWLNNLDADTTYIMELQAEPWLADTESIPQVPIDRQLTLMNAADFKKQILFAQRTRMPRAYLWGIEWWYWLRKQGSVDITPIILDLKKQ